MKKLLALSLALCAILTSIPAAFAADDTASIALAVDGKGRICGFQPSELEAAERRSPRVEKPKATVLTNVLKTVRKDGRVDDRRKATFTCMLVNFTAEAVEFTDAAVAAERKLTATELVSATVVSATVANEAVFAHRFVELGARRARPVLVALIPFNGNEVLAIYRQQEGLCLRAWAKAIKKSTTGGNANGGDDPVDQPERAEFTIPNGGNGDWTNFTIGNGATSGSVATPAASAGFTTGGTSSASAGFTIGQR